MVALPICGRLVKVSLPEGDDGRDLAAFLISCGLSRERVESAPIRHPQAWADTVLRSLDKPARLGSRTMTNLQRAKEMLPVYLEHSDKLRPRWATDAALVDLLMRQETPSGRWVEPETQDAAGLVSDAVQAVLGHRFVHDDSCRVCYLAFVPGAGRSLLREARVDGRVAWDLVQALEKARLLPELTADLMADPEEYNPL